MSPDSSDFALLGNFLFRLSIYRFAERLKVSSQQKMDRCPGSPIFMFEEIAIEPSEALIFSHS
jgi:hypothetical protein